MNSRKKHIALAALLLALAIQAPLAAPLVAGGAVTSILDLDGSGRCFDLPFPSELWKGEDGSLDMDRFPNSGGLETVDRTMAGLERGYGFSTGGTIYFRFTGGLDPESFPDERASMEKDSPMFLVDVDPDSPDKGKRFPVMAAFYPRGPSYMKHQTNLLAIMPVPGFVLRENTLYAAGVTTELHDANGVSLGKNPELAVIATGHAPDGALGIRALELMKPAMDALAAGGAGAGELAALTVFRTGDPTMRMQKLFDTVKDRGDYQWETPLRRTREYDLYYVLEGAVMLPQYQEGEPPYSRGKGGRIVFGEDGKAMEQRLDRVPVAFSIPKKPMPGGGFPITIYIHGTAGVSTQFIDRGEVFENSPKVTGEGISMLLGSHGVAEEGTGPALIYAQHGIAGAGAAQQHAGERGGLDEQLFYYNFPSPEALRDNMLQAAAEAAMLLRIVKGIEIDPGLCPATDAGGSKITFDPELIFGTGQSLGSLILGPWGAVETDLKVLIPAGNGAYWSLFITEGNALELGSLQKRRMGQGKVLRLDRYHPFVNMICTVLAEADPFAYQPHYINRPLPGRAPKHVWASFGILDNYFFPPAQNAAMLAMGLDFVGPIMDPSTEDMIELGGLRHLDAPVSLNRDTDQGPVTAVAAHFMEHGPLNGHHVNYQRDDAKYQYGCFLESMVNSGAPAAYPRVDQWDAPCGQQ